MVDLNEIKKRLKKIKEVKNKIKFLKSIKTRDKKLKKEIKRFIDELEKRKEHLPIEAQDLTTNLETTSLEAVKTPDVEEAVKYDPIDGVRRRKIVTSDDLEDKKEKQLIEYAVASASNPSLYDASINPVVSQRNPLERRWENEGLDRKVLESDPSERQRARKIAQEYLQTNPEKVEYFLEQGNGNIGNENINKQSLSSNKYRSLRLSRTSESLELDKKKREENTKYIRLKKPKMS